MCTATWIRQPESYELFFNRDELRSRAGGAPPRRAESAGVAYLAPTDREAGGTWIAVNELGMTLGLLNGAPPAVARPGPWTSRGHLVRSLIDAATWGEVSDRLRRRDLAALRPFTLLVLDAAGTIRRATWNGSGLELDAAEPAQPLASSSLDHSGAGDARRRLWRERFEPRIADPETHLAFRRSHLPERGPYSPCMHREEAVTVSSCRIKVTTELVELTYLPGPPCGDEPALAGESVTVELSRRAEPATAGTG